MLRAEGLRKSFGALEAAGGVSLEIAAGARHAIVGPNGSGKTTLFNLLSGELAPDSGRVFLDGRDVTRLPPDARARAGLTRSFQKNNLFAAFTVRRNLEIAAAIHLGCAPVFWRGFARIPAVGALAEETAVAIGLADVLDIPAGTLPYGSQRQLEIGLALAVAPKVLLLDEPTAGMSAAETASMKALLAGLPRAMALVVIEHDMDVVFGLAERVTVLDYGRILVAGTPDEIRASELVRRRYLGERRR